MPACTIKKVKKCACFPFHDYCKGTPEDVRVYEDGYERSRDFPIQQLSPLLLERSGCQEQGYSETIASSTNKSAETPRLLHVIAE